MNRKLSFIIILTSLISVSIISIATYFWFININEDNNDNDDDNDTIPKQILINHYNAHLENFTKIPTNWIITSKNNLHIVYFHTSHGSQLTTGMSPLDYFMDNHDIYEFNPSGSSGALHLFEPDEDDGYPYEIRDLTGYTDTFDDITRSFLSLNPEYNVVMWSWCGLDKDETAINEYLSNMNQLESEYPDIYFVYMTAHLEGTGEEGDLHFYNEMIRNYCISNNKILYDFADIESYNPDNQYFLDKYADDYCDYDSDEDGILDANWAIEWQNTHNGTATYLNGGEWYSCSCVHSQSLNGNMKAYGTWYLFARIAGWVGL